MSPVPAALEDFCAAYRAFVVELIRVGDLRPDEATPSWIGDLHDHPFDFPQLLVYDDAFAGVLQTLRQLSERWSDDAECVTAAQQIIRSMFVNEPPVRVTRSKSRGVPRMESSGSREAMASGAEPPEPQQQHQSAEPPPSATLPTAALPMAAPPDAAEPVPEKPEVRYLNAGIKDHARTDPLTINQSYALQFGVDVTKGGESGQDFSARLADAAILMQPSEESVELTIQLESDGFTLAESLLTLVVPRRGKSVEKAVVNVTPTRAGRATVTATILLKSGSYLMQMELEFSIGAAETEPATATVRGRSVGAAGYLKPREMSLLIQPEGDHYSCLVLGSTARRVVIPITEAELTSAIAQARLALMDNVINADFGTGKFPFKQGIEIDAASSEKALRVLAKAGASLLRALFGGSSPPDDLVKLGDWFRQQVLKPGTMKVQIVADRFPMPWGMLYVGDVKASAKIEWENFLGFRHIIEQLPLQSNLPVDDYVIASSPTLSIGVTVNTSIDAEMKMDVVNKQVQYWTDRSAAGGTAIAVKQRTTRAELFEALSEPTAEQLMYFYCHATTKGVTDAGGIKGATIELTGREKITIEDLDNEAPRPVKLPGSPLVFLNACESGELTPAFYDGFIPYFLAKGARGVVGTECKTPAVFATEWATRFFPRLLAGEAIGELFLALRREFMEQDRNPLGLIYAVYCDADTRIDPALSF